MAGKSLESRYDNVAGNGKRERLKSSRIGQSAGKHQKSMLVEHGTRKQYKRGCKCDDCRAANAAYKTVVVARKVAAGGVPHGTTTGYSYGCRCVECVQAKRTYEAARIFDLDSSDYPHGTRKGYVYGCHCELCSDASREYVKAWQATQDFAAEDFPHGSIAGAKRGCKCVACKAAWGHYDNARRHATDKAAPGFPHGTITGYNNKCRCDACTAVAMSHVGARKHERMETEPVFAERSRKKDRGYSAKRRAYKRSSMIDAAQILQIYLVVPDGYEVDHIIPLSKGGSHSPDNLQFLPKSENRRKRARLDYDTASVALRWQDFFDGPPTTISKESRLQAEPKRPTTSVTVG